MSRTGTLLASVFLCSALVATTAAQGKAVKDIPATSTIYDSTPAFTIQSDQRGDYFNSKTVRSVVQTAGDWILDTQLSRTTPTRSVQIDFGDFVSGTGPNGSDPISPFSGTEFNARFIAKCHKYGVNMLDIGYRGTTTCPLAVGLHNGYLIVMNPANVDGTEPVKFTCTGFGTNRCTEWTVAPFSDPPAGSRGLQCPWETSISPS